MSYDIQDVLLYNQDIDIQKKFISAAISKNKTPTNMKREFKDTYSIFYSEYKYYKDTVGSMAYNVTYRDLKRYPRQKLTATNNRIFKMQTNKTVDVTLVGAGLYKHQHLQSCIHHKINKNDSIERIKI